jgi:hypothetical protein
MKISDRYLTKGWNNLLTVVFGLPVLLYAIVILGRSDDPSLANVAVLTLPLGALY